MEIRMPDFDYDEMTVIKVVEMQGVRYCLATEREFPKFKLDLNLGKGDNPEVRVIFGDPDGSSVINFDVCLPLSAIPDAKVSSKAIVEIVAMDRDGAIDDLLSWIVAKNAKLLVKLVRRGRVCFTLKVGKTTLKQEVAWSKVDGFLERIPADA